MIYLELNFVTTMLATIAMLAWLKFGPKSDWTSAVICSGTVLAVEQLLKRPVSNFPISIARHGANQGKMSGRLFDYASLVDNGLAT